MITLQRMAEKLATVAILEACDSGALARYGQVGEFAKEMCRRHSVATVEGSAWCVISRFVCSNKYDHLTASQLGELAAVAQKLSEQSITSEEAHNRLKLAGLRSFVSKKASRAA